ncbi:unnamed protein product, partial [Polarella glacialis]
VGQLRITHSSCGAASAASGSCNVGGPDVSGKDPCGKVDEDGRCQAKCHLFGKDNSSEAWSHPSGLDAPIHFVVGVVRDEWTVS